TVTESGHVARFPAASVAVVSTVVVPSGKIEPDGGVETTLTGAEHVSLASAENGTGALHAPGLAGTEISSGHVSCGGVLSTTVTLARAWLVAPFVSFTVSSTAVVPMSYGPGGDCVGTSVSPSSSKDPSSMSARAPHAFAGAVTVTSFAFAIGTWFGGSQAPMHAPVT